MNKVVLVLIILTAFALSALYAWLRPDPAPPEGYSTLPTSDITDVSVELNTSTIAVKATDNGTVLVRSPQTFGTKLDSDTYEFSDDTPQLEKRYNLTYFVEDSFFQVSLLAEPLSEVRTEAEMELRSRLNVTQEELCQLRTSVKTDIYTNEFYAGRELGFSFCPGAVQLP